MAIEYLKRDDSAQLLEIADVPVLVDFSSSNCAPCMMMASEVETFAQNNPCVRVFSVNADFCPQTAAYFRVRIFPMMHLLFNGKVVAVTAGFHDETAITDFVQDALVNESISI